MTPIPVPDPATLADERLAAIARLLPIIDALRGPDGCPWDKEQTERSMAPCLVEEAHEVQEAIESGDADRSASEAGDVLLTTLLVCRIAQDEGRYDLARVLRTNSARTLIFSAEAFTAALGDGAWEPSVD